MTILKKLFSFINYFPTDQTIRFNLLKLADETHRAVVRMLQIHDDAVDFEEADSLSMVDILERVITSHATYRPHRLPKRS